jgi:hypothetical protein
MASSHRYQVSADSGEHPDSGRSDHGSRLRSEQSLDLFLKRYGCTPSLELCISGRVVMHLPSMLAAVAGFKITAA